MPAFASKQQTILLIDDNIVNLKVAVEHLKAYSFQIITARDGEAGIARAQLAQPDLILLDIQMPGIDGVEACRRLQANPATSSIPIIFMTGLSDVADKVRGLEAGAVDYICKPIEAAELLARVTTQLNVRALQAQLQQSNEQLEQRVLERTAALEAEVARRTREQDEKEGLFEVVRQQSEQLRQLTRHFLESQDEQGNKLQTSLQQIDQNLTELEAQLNQARRSLLPQGGTPQPARAALDALQGAFDMLARARQHTQQLGSNLAQATSAQHSLRDNPLLNLSDREYEIFHLLVQGKTNNEITEQLFLAKTTVSTYQRRIMEKLGVSDLPSLVKFAVQHHLVS